jgi:hypothetical protein
VPETTPTTKPAPNQKHVSELSTLSFTPSTTPSFLDTLLPGLEFEEILEILDINPLLTSQQQEQLKTILTQNHHAFAYGNRALGNSDIIKIQN